MNAEQRELAAKLTELPSWRWRMGMVDEDGALCVWAPESGRPCFATHHGLREQVAQCACPLNLQAWPDSPMLEGVRLPDITHPTNEGWLLRMVPGVPRTYNSDGVVWVETMVETNYKTSTVLVQLVEGGDTIGEACARACLAATKMGNHPTRASTS